MTVRVPEDRVARGGLIDGRDAAMPTTFAAQRNRREAPHASALLAVAKQSPGLQGVHDLIG
jgi:hypothetical protein